MQVAKWLNNSPFASKVASSILYIFMYINLFVCYLFIYYLYIIYQKYIPTIFPSIFQSNFAKNHTRTNRFFISELERGYDQTPYKAHVPASIKGM